MAGLPLEILNEAVEEMREARRWYAARSPEAARHFVVELNHVIEQIQNAPNRWPKHLYGTRRYRLRRFPFLMIYRVAADRIEVVACQHARRRPGYWRGR